MDVRAARADAAAARLLMAEYLDEIADRMGPGFDRSRYVDAAPEELEPPAGRLLLGYEDDRPVACGAVRVIGAGIAEIKRMYVAPQARGTGLGRTLLVALEQAAAELGCDRARLDTAATLSEAVGLYGSAGYVPIADYNGNPHATVWMERRLAS
jgi:GNAT superfamily N-acetyltransferase